MLASCQVPNGTGPRPISVLKDEADDPSFLGQMIKKLRTDALAINSFIRRCSASKYGICQGNSANLATNVLSESGCATK